MKVITYLENLIEGNIIAIDKMLHFAVGYMIADFFKNPFLGFTIVTLLSVLKEIYFAERKGRKFDTADIIASALGALLNLIIYTIYNYAG